jgi:two-component system, NtrC family, response regulator AtoC
VTLLARHFLDVFSRKYAHPMRTLAADAEALLRAYTWPGNVRELAHLMERVVLLHSDPVVKAEDLGLTTPKAAARVALGPTGRVSVDFTAGAIVLEDVERELIEKALQASNWNRATAAELLGLSRDTLRYRIEKYQLQSPTRPAGS